MADSKQKVDDIMASLSGVSADDPDMINKLNEIALKVAEAQGKLKPKSGNVNNVDTDPMNELGCEGCQ